MPPFSVGMKYKRLKEVLKWFEMTVNQKLKRVYRENINTQNSYNPLLERRIKLNPVLYINIGLRWKKRLSGPLSANLDAICIRVCWFRNFGKTITSYVIVCFWSNYACGPQTTDGCLLVAVGTPLWDFISRGVRAGETCSRWLLIYTVNQLWIFCLFHFRVI